MGKPVLVYITNPSHEHAQQLARYLLEKKLIACANLHPITGMYWWQGAIEDGSEVVLVGKTCACHVPRIEKEVTEQHEYDVPCIITIPVTANKLYEEYLKKNTLPCPA